MITEQILRAVLPECTDPARWAAALAPAMQRFGITTRDREAAFLAQTAHESSDFNRLEESLFYRAARLTKVWPRRFPTEAAAQPYAANPAKLANFVYANRMGNGSEASGDGYRYRGRGIIQVTGRSNYTQIGQALGLDLVGQPDLLLQPEHAAASAAFFWESRGLNALADDRTDDDDLEDFSEITRRINGGTVGLKERLALFKRIEAAL
ncbi:MAG: glycoside hydrolase family 19 protein [Aquabacterium sp.]|nr:MAG: glycoside hydrolase family 19 protein [Aquabacterium sp.]